MKNWFASKKNQIDTTLPKDSAALEQGVLARLAGRLKIEPNAVNIENSFSDMGLDSIGAVRLMGELEEWLQIELDPTMLYTKASVSELVVHLASVLSLQEAAPVEDVASL